VGQSKTSYWTGLQRSNKEAGSKAEKKTELINLPNSQKQQKTKPAKESRRSRMNC